MSGTALVYAAELNPGKPEIAREHGGLQEIDGSYRLVDHRGGEVGVEALIGPDEAGRLVQLPVSYRSHQIAPDHALTSIQHSVLGRRFVTHALADPVAVRELIRTIVTGDDGAAYSDGTVPYLDIRGSGSSAAEIGDVQVTGITRERCTGTVQVDGTETSFTLTVPRLLQVRESGSELELTAPDPRDPQRRLLVAALTLG